MKAEREDMPEWIRSRKKPNRWRGYTLIALGSAATWAFISNYAKPVTIDLKKLSEIIFVGRNTPVAASKTLEDPAFKISRTSILREIDDLVIKSRVAGLESNILINKNSVWAEAVKESSSGVRGYYVQGEYSRDNLIWGSSSVGAPESLGESRGARITIIQSGEKRPGDLCPWRVGSIENRNCKFRMNLSGRNK